MAQLQIVRLSDTSASIGDWRGIDAVVFVHGIGGHYRDTWGRFPELVASDPDLPELDILLWGYRTSLLPSDVHSTGIIARNLVSELRIRLRTDVAACLVAHSMGGLIVLQGLIEEMKQDRARKHPTCSIQHLSLFAVPTRGSTAADVAANWIESLGLPEGSLNDQIKSLGGEVCDALMAEVTERIYDPPQEGPSACRIPIRSVLASRDAAVGEVDSDMTKSPFQNPPPLELDYGHRDIKQPATHLDVRYLALANDLQLVVAVRFAEISRRILDGSDAQRSTAEIDLEIRYGRLLRRRFIDAGGSLDDQPRLCADFCCLVMRDCLTHGRPPFDAADRAVVVLRRNGYLGHGY